MVKSIDWGTHITMTKLPPIEKIYEAFTAIADGRVIIKGDSAAVKSSDGVKTYTVTWSGSQYASDDNGTYWQGYAGYPVIAVLMLQGRISLDVDIPQLLSGVNWNALNAKHKKNYAKAFEEAAAALSGTEKERIITEAAKVYTQLKELDIIFRRGKSR